MRAHLTQPVIIHLTRCHPARASLLPHLSSLSGKQHRLSDSSAGSYHLSYRGRFSSCKVTHQGCLHVRAPMQGQSLRRAGYRTCQWHLPEKTRSPRLLKCAANATPPSPQANCSELSLKVSHVRPSCVLLPACGVQDSIPQPD